MNMHPTAVAYRAAVAETIAARATGDQAKIAAALAARSAAWTAYSSARAPYVVGDKGAALNVADIAFAHDSAE